MHRAADHDGLHDELTKARSADQQAEILALYASRQVQTPNGRAEAAELLTAAAQGETVAATSTRLGLSSRQLQRRYLGHFGMPPTVLRRILRLHSAAEAWTTASTATVASLAAQAGYADQAHFARETRTLTLSSPSQTLRASPAVMSDPYKTARGRGT
ncbi:helix-turn-helix domain-containing protein [Actinomycetota bacterium]